MSLPKTFLCFLVCAASGASSLRAGENLFGTITGVDPVPKTRFQFKQLVGLREERNTGDYHGIEFRTGMEYGLATNLEASVYVNTSYVSSHGVVSANGKPQTRQEDFRFDTVSAEFKYMVLSPYKDAFGLAFDFRPGVGPQIQDLPVRVLLQKTFLDDTLVWGTEAGALWEWNGVAGNNTSLFWATGLSYRFISNWSAAVEIFSRNGFTGLDFSGPSFTTCYVGPTLHYAAEKWWVTLSALAQVAGHPNTEDGKYLDRQERLFARLAIGINF